MIRLKAFFRTALRCWPLTVVFAAEALPRVADTYGTGWALVGAVALGAAVCGYGAALAYADRLRREGRLSLAGVLDGSNQPPVGPAAAALNRVRLD